MAGDECIALTRARAIGAKKYNSNIPCLHGHTLRYVKRGTCVECGLSSQRKSALTRTPEKAARKKAQSGAWCRSAHGLRKMRNVFLLRCYGITVDQYDALLAKQGGVCALCKDVESQLNHYGSNRAEENPLTRLSVDHCHATNRVRGILCRRCNSMIASARDNPETLERAAGYLRLDQPATEGMFVRSPIAPRGRKKTRAPLP